jgi:hypothetical protein
MSTRGGVLQQQHNDRHPARQSGSHPPVRSKQLYTNDADGARSERDQCVGEREWGVGYQCAASSGDDGATTGRRRSSSLPPRGKRIHTDYTQRMMM